MAKRFRIQVALPLSTSFVFPDVADQIIQMTEQQAKLVSYRQTARLQTWICGVVSVSAVDSITDVYTVSQLKQKAQENPEAFFGITYSFISKFDLDSAVSKVIRTRW